jgi:UDP:flavonoid glycosyltransferase YjiC (YdhE family)
MPDGNWLSHVSRTLGIAKVLRKMGFRVIFAGSGEYMKLPRAEEFEIMPLLTLSPERALKVVRGNRVNFYNYRWAKDCVKEELKLFDKVKPDLVLNDFRLTLNTSCEVAHIPLTAIVNASMTNYYAIPDRCPDNFFLSKIINRRSTDPITPFIKNFILRFDARPLNRVRKQYGLPIRNNMWDILRGDFNLIADIPDYGPTKNLPDNYHYIGPLLWEPEMEPPAWLKSIDPKKPCIYFTMGSTGLPKFFQQAIDLFGNTDYQCIMTTAGMVQLNSPPANFYICDYAPGSKIMQVADAVVCHGGNGTIYQALSCGVPIIGIPAMLEQQFNLDQVVALGAGIYVSEVKFKPENLQNAVKTIINDSKYKENALKYAKIMSTYNAPVKGAELISSLLST